MTNMTREVSYNFIKRLGLSRDARSEKIIMTDLIGGVSIKAGSVLMNNMTPREAYNFVERLGLKRDQSRWCSE